MVSWYCLKNVAIAGAKLQRSEYRLRAPCAGEIGICLLSLAAARSLHRTAGEDNTLSATPYCLAEWAKPALTPVTR
jgi:hypothetical protein